VGLTQNELSEDTHDFIATHLRAAAWLIVTGQEYEERRPEEEVLPALEELGIGFVPFSPLGWLRSRGSFPSRAPRSWGVWTRTCELLQSDLRPTRAS
jgi:aryl-alcohol dehydrogenase-like predicted oxidoreductase